MDQKEEFPHYCLYSEYESIDIVYIQQVVSWKKTTWVAVLPNDISAMFLSIKDFAIRKNSQVDKCCPRSFLNGQNFSSLNQVPLSFSLESNFTNKLENNIAMWIWTFYPKLPAQPETISCKVRNQNCRKHRRGFDICKYQTSYRSIS